MVSRLIILLLLSLPLTTPFGIHWGHRQRGDKVLWYRNVIEPASYYGSVSRYLNYLVRSLINKNNQLTRTEQYTLTGQKGNEHYGNNSYTGCSISGWNGGANSWRSWTAGSDPIV